jgi:hypothetical protein
MAACEGTGSPAGPSDLAVQTLSEPLPSVTYGALWTRNQNRYREGDTIVFRVNLWVTGNRPIFALPFFVREDGQEYQFQGFFGPFDDRAEGHYFAVAQQVFPYGFKEFAGDHTLRARVDFHADGPDGPKVDELKIPLDYFVCADYFSCY